jgi:hypothetical protein
MLRLELLDVKAGFERESTLVLDCTDCGREVH